MIKIGEDKIIDDMLISNMSHVEMQGLCPSLAAVYEIKQGHLRKENIAEDTLLLKELYRDK